MHVSERTLLRIVLRNDFASCIHRCFQTVSPGQRFLPNWHINAMAWHLTECLRGNIKRLIITLSPRNLKSIGASVAFPAWVLGHDPTRRIICVSYSEGLAARHSRDCRAVVESDWYRRAFPGTRISPEKNTELEFATTAGGFRLATSVGGTLTGRGGSIIVIDDSLKPEEAQSEARREAVNQWYDNTLYSRLDNKAEGAIILVTQRLHVDDLVGHVLEKEDWVHLNLPAIATEPQWVQLGPGEYHFRAAGDVLHPERESREDLDKPKASMGSFNFSAQYQQNPIPPEGNMISWEWFRTYSALPPKGPGDPITQSWDTASTDGKDSDYSVCTTWLSKGADHYLIEVVRVRLLYPHLKKLIVEQARKFSPNAVLIEDKGPGLQLIQDLRHEGELYPIQITPEVDKITRASRQSVKIEAGQVHLPLPGQARWLKDFHTEVLQFPSGKHDDQVDSMTQFLEWKREQNWSSVEFHRELLRLRAQEQRRGLRYVIDGEAVPIPWARKLGF